MRTDLIVIDNFYKDPNAVKAYARQQRYYYPYQRDQEIAQGAPPKWLTSFFCEAADCPFKSSASLIQALSDATGEIVDREHWTLSFPRDSEGKAAIDCEDVKRSCLWNCSFHLKPFTEQRLGEGVHNHVTDIWNSVGPDGWAGLVYLDPTAPLDGGLKLWRNRNPERNFDWMTPAENWELVDNLGNVFNRLILARGSLPHSGAEGWGDSLDNGRFFQTFFFRVNDPKCYSGVEVPMKY